MKSQKDRSNIQDPETVVVKPLSPHYRATQKRLSDSSTPSTITLGLPDGSSLSVSVIEGPEKGFQYPISRPLVTFGRVGGGADIQIDDPKISRLHCSVEVKRNAILVRDLNSMNGTCVGEGRVLVAALVDGSEFRIGSSVFRITVSAHPES